MTRAWKISGSSVHENADWLWPNDKRIAVVIRLLEQSSRRQGAGHQPDGQSATGRRARTMAIPGRLTA